MSSNQPEDRRPRLNLLPPGQLPPPPPDTKYFPGFLQNPSTSVTQRPNPRVAQSLLPPGQLPLPAPGSHATYFPGLSKPPISPTPHQPVSRASLTTRLSPIPPVLPSLTPEATRPAAQSVIRRRRRESSVSDDGIPFGESAVTFSTGRHHSVQHAQDAGVEIEDEEEERPTLPSLQTARGENTAMGVDPIQAIRWRISELRKEIVRVRQRVRLGHSALRGREKELADARDARSLDQTEVSKLAK